MSFAFFVKKTLMDYFIAVFGITIAIAVLGLQLDPDTTFGYDAYFSPIIIGAIAMLPSIVLYSPRELSFRHMLVRKLIHFILLELTLLCFGYYAKLLKDVTMALSFALSVFLVYILIIGARWLIDSKAAGEINEGLEELKNSYEDK